MSIGTFAEYMALLDPNHRLSSKDTIKIQRHWSYLQAKYDYEVSFLKYTIKQMLRRKTMQLNIEIKIQDDKVSVENIDLPRPSP